MTPLIVFGVLVALLFGGAYLTKRRFGILGLALAGGSLLADLWGMAGGLFFAAADIYLSTLSPENLALVFIILLPACLLLLHGPTHQSSLQRLVSAMLFTLLAVSLALQPLQSLLMGSEIGIAIFRNLMQFKDLIITVGLAAAFVDMFFMKALSRSKSGSKH
jgi:hypothetical protein